MVIGHSFVRRFKNYCIEIDEVNNISRVIRVDKIVDRVEVWGKSGAKINDLFRAKEIISDLKPQFALIDIGTNDLNSKAHPHWTAKKTYELALYLVEKHGLLNVIIFEVTFREDIALGKIIAHNEELKRLCRKGDYRISTLSHKGLTKNNIELWSSDKLHANTRKGKELYLQSIRNGIFRAVRNCNYLVKNKELVGEERSGSTNNLREAPNSLVCYCVFIC